MKRILLVVSILAVFVATHMVVYAGPNAAGVGDKPGIAPAAPSCVAISTGTLLSPNGERIPPSGKDAWGYSYKRQSFKGTKCASLYQPEGCGESFNVTMTWNSAYLAAEDCDGDGRLDQHLGYATYQGSGASVTITSSGTDAYGYPAGTAWQYSARFDAVPANAQVAGPYWYWYDDAGALQVFRREYTAGFEYFVRTELVCVNCQ